MSQNIIRELLQLMFLGELLSPSKTKRLWIACPLISNIVIFDNRAGGFAALNPEWGNREIRLIEVTVNLMLRGNPIGIISGIDNYNETFGTQITDATSEAGIDGDNLVMNRLKKLHTQGILTSRGLLSGSMNLTYNGIDMNGESLTYVTNPTTIEEAKTSFDSYMMEKD